MMSSMMSEEEMAQMEQGGRKPDMIRLSFIVIRLDH